MVKLGIIGYPLEHSLSPIMHNTALQYLNVGGEYVAYETKEEDLEKRLKEIIDSGVKGLNVTIPYKTKIIKFLDELSENAKLANAVNTITIRDDGKLIGDNTDIIGFWEAIPVNFRETLKDKNVAVIGNGGAALGAITALLINNIKSLHIYGRSKENLNIFYKSLIQTKEFTNAKTEINTSLISDIKLNNISLLINTTPVGMHPKINESPIPKEKLLAMPKDSLVYDLIYNPEETLLLKNAKSLGLNTLNGLDMLVIQGASSLAIWLELSKRVTPIGIMKLAINQVMDLTTS